MHAPLLVPSSEKVLTRDHLRGLGPVQGLLAIYRCADLEPGLYRLASDELSRLADWTALEPVFRSWHGQPGRFPAALLLFTGNTAGSVAPVGDLRELEIRPLLGAPAPNLWSQLVPDAAYFQGWSVEPRAQDSEGEGLENFLRLAGPALSPPLFSSPSVLRLSQLARRLSIPISMAFFECRLASDDPIVDVSLELARVEGSYLRALRHAPAEWTGLHRLAQQADEQRLKIATLGLEFDAETVLQSPLYPAVFVGCEPNMSRSSAEAVTQALDPTLWQQCAGAVDEFYARLPQGAEVLFLGLFPGRGLDAVRLNVKYPEHEAKVEHLRRLFPATHSDYSPALQLTAEATLQIATFDIYPTGVGDRVGFEVEGELLGQLSELCCPQKIGQLESWPGTLLEAEDPMPWPVGLRSRGELRSAMIRSIGHLKVTIKPGTGLSFKAYPTLAHLRFDLREVQKLLRVKQLEG